MAHRAGTVLRLPRAEFDELVVAYPQILELVSELTDERQQTQQVILDGRAEWTQWDGAGVSQAPGDPRGAGEAIRGRPPPGTESMC